MYKGELQVTTTLREVREIRLIKKVYPEYIANKNYYNKGDIVQLANCKIVVMENKFEDRRCVIIDTMSGLFGEELIININDMPSIDKLTTPIYDSEDFLIFDYEGAELANGAIYICNGEPRVMTSLGLIKINNLI